MLEPPHISVYDMVYRLGTSTRYVHVYVPYIKVVPGYFLSFEAFVLFAQAPDEGN